MSHKMMIVAVLLCAASVEADITVTEWTLNTLVRNPQVLVSETAPPVVLPFNVVSNATDGESEATSTYDFDVVGDFGSFVFDFDHDRDGAPGSAAISGGFLFFSVPADSCRLSYRFSGDYTMKGEDRLQLGVFLDDLGVGTVFLSEQQSRNTPNQSFTLGETEGDSGNTLIGELEGSLIPGHDYQLSYGYFLHRASLDPDTGATAVGSLNLNIFACPPEPTCAADLNGDGVVNAADLAELLAAWGACPE